MDVMSMIFVVMTACSAVMRRVQLIELAIIILRVPGFANNSCMLTQAARKWRKAGGSGMLPARSAAASDASSTSAAPSAVSAARNATEHDTAAQQVGRHCTV